MNRRKLLSWLPAIPFGLVAAKAAATEEAPKRAVLSGTGVAANTVITNQLTGTTGGSGTYAVSIGDPPFAVGYCQLDDYAAWTRHRISGRGIGRG